MKKLFEYQKLFVNIFDALFPYLCVCVMRWDNLAESEEQASKHLSDARHIKLFHGNPQSRLPGTCVGD